MRAGLWVLALFALAVALTLAARLDQSYVIIVYPPWRMELSFMLALLLLAGILGLAYVFFRLAGIALNLSGDLRAWRMRKRENRADLAMFDAFRAYFDGDPQRAATLAAKAGESKLAPDLVERLQNKIKAETQTKPQIKIEAEQAALLSE